MHRLVGIVLCGLLSSSSVLAAEPTWRLLPAHAALAVQVRDVRQFRSQLSETSAGRLARDPALALWVDPLGTAALDALIPASAAERRPAAEPEEPGFAEALRDAWRRPWGEMVFLLLPAGKDELSWGLSIAAEDCLPQARQLLELYLTEQVQSGLVRRTETIQGLRVHALYAGEVHPTLVATEQAGKLLASDRVETLLLLLGLTPEGQTGPIPKLVDDPRWRQLTERWQTPAESTANVRWWVDTEALAGVLPEIGSLPTAAARAPGGRPAASLVAAGAAWLPTGRYELLAKTALLVPPGPDGARRLPGLSRGEVAAPRYVPATAALYGTLHGSWGTPTGVVNPSDKPPLFKDRGAYSLWPDPQRAGHWAALWGVELAAPEAFANTLATEAEAGRLRRRERAGYPYYLPTEEEEGPGRVVLAGSLLVVTPAEAIETVIDVWAGKSAGLTRELDYRFAASRLDRLAGDRPPTAAAFLRPGACLQVWHARLTQAPSVPRETVGPLSYALAKALRGVEQLPDIERLTRRLAPAAAIWVEQGEVWEGTVFWLARGRGDETEQ